MLRCIRIPGALIRDRRQSGNYGARSWDSFTHTHATLLSAVGESLRTAQAMLGHSDLETTLNVYACGKQEH